MSNQRKPSSGLLHASAHRKKKRRRFMKRKLSILSLLLLILLLAACGGSSSTISSTEATTVQVKETEFSIDSSVTSFSPGTTYHFVVTNTGKTAHELMIMPKSMGSMAGMPMGGMDHMALASISNLNPGETKTLDYTFPHSAEDTHPELACYLPGHYEAGMKLGVTVKA
jgi:uncharacterized cupredoxin-like copper-binding protein